MGPVGDKPRVYSNRQTIIILLSFLLLSNYTVGFSKKVRIASANSLGMTRLM